MASYDRMVGRSGGHTADGLGSTRSSGADKFNEAMKGQEGDLVIHEGGANHRVH
jgi:hypothetical protein